LWAIQRNEKCPASILQQLCKGPTSSICAIGSEEWHRDNGYDPADDDDLPDLSLDSDDNDDDNEDELEEGNHILYTVFTPVKEICAGSTISGCLQQGVFQLSAGRADMGPMRSQPTAGST
jgi:hypothetical protein